MEFNWKTDDESIPSAAIGDAVPDRATLAQTCIVVNEAKEVLLIDPHPAGTWETWMFPYSSFILANEVIRDGFPEARFLRLSRGSALSDVSDALVQILEHYEREYQEAVLDGMNQVVPELVGLAADIVSVDYSLKYSKTSGSYTAYRFEGSKIDAESDTLHVAVPSIWLPVDELPHMAAGDVLKGRAIAGNVRDTLQSLSVQ